VTEPAEDVRPGRLPRDRETITTSASSVSAIATTVRSCGFAGVVNRHRTLAGFVATSCPRELELDPARYDGATRRWLRQRVDDMALCAARAGRELGNADVMMGANP